MSTRINRIDGLIAELTLEEKVSLLAGADMWNTAAVERLGIPPLKVTDGPNGARGSGMRDGTSSACFPCGTALAATWNPQLVEQVGGALANETKSKGAQILLGPTVNIHRSPIAGRNFECYSEDPHLSSRIVVAFVGGLQAAGVSACVKHFVCNDSEFERNTISSEVGERALREIYLPPFEAAVIEAGAQSMMTAYNRVNGTYAAEHRRLITDVLRGEWGFQGFLVSDWFGTRSTAEALNAGLDLEMPGPGRYRGEKLVEALRRGEVEEKTLDASVRRILEAIERAGLFERAPALGDVEQSLDRPEDRALARRAASEGTVLLRNAEATLPLNPSELRRLAVIGPSADCAAIQGGGSARVNPHYEISPLEGIRAQLSSSVEVSFERGCTNHRSIPVLESRYLATPSGEPGGELTLEFFDNLELAGEPVLTRSARRADFTWFGGFSELVDEKAFSVRLRGRFAAPESGRFTFSLISAGVSRLRIDGRELIDNWTQQTRGDSFFGMGSTEVSAEVELAEGKIVELEIEYSRREAPIMAGLRCGYLAPVHEDAMDRAVRSAARADAAVVVVGLNHDWEREGVDRENMDLPGRQAELIQKIAAANPRTIVVVNAGSPVRMDWIDSVPAALQLWYPGQECGNALADILFGETNPSGRLPTTFPVRLEDNPAYINYPGEGGRVHYGEGIFVGYRYYDAKKIEPRFPFGHGLSYTSFDYGDLSLETGPVRRSEPVQLSLEVTNVGDRRGQEVVQIYARDLTARVARPEKELVAFQKVDLESGESRRLHFELDWRALSFYDPGESAWIAENGEFELLAGSSSRDIRGRVGFSLDD